MPYHGDNKEIAVVDFTLFFTVLVENVVYV